MVLGADATALLEAFSEPTLVIGCDGTIIYGNRASMRLFESEVSGKAISSFCSEDEGALKRYLDRCLGSGQPLVGALTLRDSDPSQKFQCRGSLVSANGQRAILLRLSRADEERFAALSRKVEELGRDLSERQRMKAILEETLRERELLLRELQHRVKNNMHMLAAMLTGAEREASSPEAKTALREASLRFSAVSAVQQLLYSSDSLETIGSEALVATLVRAAISIAPDEVEAEVTVDPIELPIDAALPVALMLNELLTNAVKYGRSSSGRQKLRVHFLLKDNEIEVAVKDNGPGFDPKEQQKRASGIGLVRGLLRQLGGALHLERHDGAHCFARFPDPRNSARGAE